MDDQTTVVKQEGIFEEILDTSPYEKSMKNARVWLYIIAGLQAAMGLYEYFVTDDQTVALFALIIDVAIGCIFLVVSLWSKKKPYMAFILALCSYVIIHVGFMFLDPTNIYKGIILKVFIIVALSKAIKDAKKYEDVKAAMN